MANNVAISLPKSVQGIISEDELDRRIHDKVNALMQQGEFEEKDVTFISKFTLPAASGELQTSKELLERLRRAAQVWDVELKPKEFTSHRPVVGKVIVGIKKALFPIISFFLADSLRQQRDFNAAVLRCLVELSKEKNS